MREGRLTTRPVRLEGVGDERRMPYHQASEGKGGGGGVMREGRLTTRPVREGGGVMREGRLTTRPVRERGE